MNHRQFVWSMILITVVAFIIMWAIPFGQDFIANWNEMLHAQSQVK
jgi:hypothetical protein